jgi:myosin-1
VQQIFIELTLKSEQEEYVTEKIQWQQVEYFNNLPCVELIERKNGIFAILDEECVFPNGTDQSFLDKLHKQCKGHAHYEMSANAQEVKQCFGVVHYAGKVTYNRDGFLDKNKDTLFSNLKAVLQASENQFIQQLYPVETVNSLKRPPSAVAQFKVIIADDYLTHSFRIK